MPRKVQPWFRWYTEAAHDRKMRRLTPAQRWLFVAMCSAAKESPELGRLLVAVDEGMTDREVAEYADVSLREVAKALPVLSRLGMVERDAEGVLVVTNMQQRQYASDTSAERTKNYRERHSDVDSDDVVTSQHSHKERHSDGVSDVPETEAETEQKKSGPRKRGSRITDGWMPSPEVKAKMMAERPGVDYRTEHQNFIDHFLAASGQGATKVDWDAAWRKWMRSARILSGGTASGSGVTRPQVSYEMVDREPPE